MPAALYLSHVYSLPQRILSLSLFIFYLLIHPTKTVQWSLRERERRRQNPDSPLFKPGDHLQPQYYCMAPEPDAGLFVKNYAVIMKKETFPQIILLFLGQRERTRFS